MLEPLYYVINSPYFWGSMGFTVAIGMFTGSLIYDGELRQIQKGIYSIISYAGMILWVNYSRITETLNRIEDHNDIDYAMAYAGMATIFIVTVFWLTGMMIGVLMNKIIHHNMHRI